MINNPENELTDQAKSDITTTIFENDEHALKSNDSKDPNCNIESDPAVSSADENTYFVENNSAIEAQQEGFVATITDRAQSDNIAEVQAQVMSHGEDEFSKVKSSNSSSQQDYITTASGKDDDNTTLEDQVASSNNDHHSGDNKAVSPGQQQVGENSMSPHGEKKMDVESFRLSLSPTVYPQIHKIYWAYMSGFPTWPARVATAAEVHNMKSSNPQVQKSKDAILVCFFGDKCDRGWVSRSHIYDFTPQRLGGLILSNKLDVAHNYRSGLLEAIRILSAKGEVFPPSIVSILTDLQRAMPTNSRSRNEAEVCQSCMGTAASGPMNYCGECQLNSIHLHCLPEQRRDNGTVRLQGSEPAIGTRWVCPTCSNLFQVPLNSYLPLPPMKAFFGTVTRYLPASDKIPSSSSSATLSRFPSRFHVSNIPVQSDNPSEKPRAVPVVSIDGDQLYHISWDDGDEQDYEEYEFRAGLQLGDRLGAAIASSNALNTQLTPHEIGQRWTTRHPAVGRRVAAYFHFDDGVAEIPTEEVLRAAKRRPSLKGKKVGGRKSTRGRASRDTEESSHTVEEESVKDIDSKRRRVSSSSLSQKEKDKSKKDEDIAAAVVANAATRSRGRPRSIATSVAVVPSDDIADDAIPDTSEVHPLPADLQPQPQYVDSTSSNCEVDFGSTSPPPPLSMPVFADYHSENQRVSALASQGLQAMAQCRAELESLDSPEVSLVDRRAAYRCSVSKCVATLSELQF